MKALELKLEGLISNLHRHLSFTDGVKPDTASLYDVINCDDVMVTVHSLLKTECFIYLNDKQKAFYGFEENDQSHLNISFYLKTFHPLTYHTLIQSNQFFHRNDLGYYKMTYRLKNADGDYKKVSGISKTVAWNEQGGACYALSVLCEEDKMLMLNAGVLFDLSPLTQRPTECLSLLLRGLRNGQIAQEMGISERTVEKHIETILKTTGAPSRSELIRRCATFQG